MQEHLSVGAAFIMRLKIIVSSEIEVPPNDHNLLLSHIHIVHGEYEMRTFLGTLIFSHVIHHIFGVRLVVENNTTQCMLL